MGNFALFFEQQFFFLDTVVSVVVLGFANIVVAVVVGCNFLSTERVWGFFWVSIS